MELRTNAQNSRFHQLLILRKMEESDKREIVEVCTNGRTRKSSEMTVDEMATAIQRLETEVEKSVKKMRAKIINIARDIFGLADKDKWEQTHFDQLNKFLVKSVKNPLHKLDLEGLRVGVTAMENWRKSATKAMVKKHLNAI